MEPWKGVVLHPSVVVENWEKCISCKGPPWRARGINSISGSLVQSTSAGKRSPHNIGCKKSMGIVSDRERQESARDPGTLLKGHCTKSCSRALPWALAEGWWLRADWSQTERGWVVQFWRESYTSSCHSSCAQSLSHTFHRCHFSWVEHSLYASSAWGGCTSSNLWTPWGPALLSLHPVKRSAGCGQQRPAMQTFSQASPRGPFPTPTPCMPQLAPQFLCRALPSHRQILICFSLMNSTGITLTTPWDPAPSQRPRTGGGWPYCTMRLFLSRLRSNTSTKLESLLAWWTPLAHTCWLTENLPHVTHVQSQAFSDWA